MFILAAESCPDKNRKFQYFISIKQFIALPKSVAKEEKQEHAPSSETVEQQCPILNDAKSQKPYSPLSNILKPFKHAFICFRSHFGSG
jgi:hypothetical protein